MQRTSIINRRRVPVDEYLAIPEVKSWYDSKRSKHTMIYRLASFVEWRRSEGLPSDPVAWIAECLEGTTRTLAEHSKAIEEWANGKSMLNKDFSSRRRYSTDVKGFYLHHHIQLPRISISQTTQDDASVELSVTASQYLEMARKVLSHPGVSVRDRSIIMTVIQTAMDESTLARVFNYVAFPQLAAYFGTQDFTFWDESQTPIRIDLTRPKTGYRYYTFLGRDGLALLKEYLKERTEARGPIRVYAPRRPKELPRSDPIYLKRQLGGAVSPGNVGEAFRDCGKEAGVNVPPESARGLGAKVRYPFHAHQARDTLITLRQREKVDRAVVDFFAGHKFDEDGYDSPWDNPDLFRQEYARLEKHLNLVSGREAAIREEIERGLEPRIKVLEAERKELESKMNEMRPILDEMKRRLGAPKPEHLSPPL